MRLFDVAVVGAGPAGLMAAGRAAERGAKVVLIEKNLRPGNKLLLTGKERCNITNAETDTRKFIDTLGQNGKFLFSCMSDFGVTETLAFFHQLGLSTKVENGFKVFPASDKASDVLNTLMRHIQKHNVTLLTDSAIKSIEHSENHITRIRTKKGQDIVADNYIICTGGLSYPSSGSSGDGYTWARQLGHTIVPPEPSLVAVSFEASWRESVQAVELAGVKVSILQNQKKIDEQFGDVMFTHEGINGPIIIELSRNMGAYLHKGKVQMNIDVAPTLSAEELDHQLQRTFEHNHLKQVKNSIDNHLPKRLIPVVLDMANINPDKPVASINKEERRQLVSLLKTFPLGDIKLAGFERAIITAGGISLKEVDQKTMRSKLVDNLYFAGEVLDLDGPSGGYNLQICWSTGYAAGTAAAGTAAAGTAAAGTGAPKAKYLS